MMRRALLDAAAQEAEALPQEPPELSPRHGPGAEGDPPCARRHGMRRRGMRRRCCWCWCCRRRCW